MPGFTTPTQPVKRELMMYLFCNTPCCISHGALIITHANMPTHPNAITKQCLSYKVDESELCPFHTNRWLCLPLPLSLTFSLSVSLSPHLFTIKDRNAPTAISICINLFHVEYKTYNGQMFLSVNRLCLSSVFVISVWLCLQKWQKKSCVFQPFTVHLDWLAFVAAT